MTIGDWNCLSEESEATRNLSIIIQISPPASSPEGIVSLEMTPECGFMIILIMRSLLKSVIGNLFQHLIPKLVRKLIKDPETSSG